MVNLHGKECLQVSETIKVDGTAYILIMMYIYTCACIWETLYYMYLPKLVRCSQEVLIVLFDKDWV